MKTETTNVTEMPTAKLLPTIITAELAALALRRDDAGAAWDAQVCRLAIALLAPPAPLKLEAPAAEPGKRKRGRPPGNNGVPPSVADIAGGKP